MNHEGEILKSAVEQRPVIGKTSHFNEAIDQGYLNAAEQWMLDNKDKPNYDEGWLDDRSRDLFRAYRKKEDWVAAKRMVELASDENGKAGRRQVLEAESGMSYDEI
ncbi:hypothetical protein HON36_02710 [Candidatus Parcubacteria bacterium]|jgi:hypothetical protein|nr:hypothetical protein [Candidatus Parcubacteria bacterium]